MGRIQVEGDTVAGAISQAYEGCDNYKDCGIGWMLQSTTDSSREIAKFRLIHQQLKVLEFRGAPQQPLKRPLLHAIRGQMQQRNRHRV